MLAAYVDELFSGTPINAKLPLHSYGAGGCYMAYEAKLKEMYGYQDFKNEVLQHFRDFGNCVLFMLLLDNCLKIYDTGSFTMWAPVLGITPASYVAEKTPPPESSPLYTVIQVYSYKKLHFTTVGTKRLSFKPTCRC